MPGGHANAASGGWGLRVVTRPFAATRIARSLRHFGTGIACFVLLAGSPASATPRSDSSSDPTEIVFTDLALSITESADPVTAGAATGSPVYVVTLTNLGPVATTEERRGAKHS